MIEEDRVVTEELVFPSREMRDKALTQFKEGSLLGVLFKESVDNVTVDIVDDYTLSVTGKAIDVCYVIFINVSQFSPYAISGTLVNLRYKYGFVLGTPKENEQQIMEHVMSVPVVWDPDLIIDEGFSFDCDQLHLAKRYLERLDIEQSWISSSTVKVRGRAIDVCNTMMEIMVVCSANTENIHNVGKHLAEKYGFTYDGLTPNMNVDPEPKFTSEQKVDWITEGMGRKKAAGTIQAFTARPVIREDERTWEKGYLSHSLVPDEIMEKYDRAVDLYNSLNDNTLSGEERVPLLKEMQELLSPSLLCYAFKRHQDDFE